MQASLSTGLLHVVKELSARRDITVRSQIRTAYSALSPRYKHKYEKEARGHHSARTFFFQSLSKTMSSDETSPLLQDPRHLLQQVINNHAPQIPTIPEEAGVTPDFGPKLLASLVVDSIPGTTAT